MVAGGRILSATGRRRRESQARYTSPIDPDPSFSRTWKCPMTRPIIDDSFASLARRMAVVARLRCLRLRRARDHGPALACKSVTIEYPLVPHGPRRHRQGANATPHLYLCGFCV